MSVHEDQVVEHKDDVRDGKCAQVTARMSELEERGLIWCEAKDTAQNRVKWRILVEDLYFTKSEEN